MRIIAGFAKGRPILAPKHMATRPTLDRVKESLFGILQFEIPGSAVLDLYAGSGNLGLESLSRGAKSAVFVDYDRACCALIKKNLDALGLQGLIMHMDAMQAISRLRDAIFDIVFLDPPYRDGAQEALHMLFAGGLIGKLAVVEHAWDMPPNEEPALFTRTDRRKYGDTGISFYTPLPS